MEKNCLLILFDVFLKKNKFFILIFLENFIYFLFNSNSNKNKNLENPSWKTKNLIKKLIYFIKENM